MAGKIIPFPGKQRERQIKPLTGWSKRFVTEEFHVGRREKHTQKGFVPEAMNLSLVTTSRWKSPARKAERESGGKIRSRSPSTLRLNNSNVKRKAKARGRTK